MLILSSPVLRQQGTATHDKVTGLRFTVGEPRIAGLPGATGNHRRRAKLSGAKLDVNRRVGISGERTQRRRAIGA